MPLVEDNKPVLEAELGPGFTTVFRWDDSTVGVLSPRERIVALYSVAAGAEPRSSQLQLLPGFDSGGGPIYPDLVQRHRSGDLYWLAKSKNQIGVFTERGDFKRLINLRSDGYSWFEVHEDTTIVAHATSHHADFVGYETYSGNGRIQSASRSWLRVEKEQAPLGALFFFEFQPASRLEVLTAFPYVRTTASPEKAHQVECAAIPKTLRDQYRQAKQNGLPVPLGTGYNSTHPKQPFALSAARGRDKEVFILVNGGVVVRIQANDSWQTDCWTSPKPTASYVPTSLAIVGRRLAILTQENGAQTTRLRVWDLAR